jgi:hypothetical protein
VHQTIQKGPPSLLPILSGISSENLPVRLPPENLYSTANDDKGVFRYAFIFFLFSIDHSDFNPFFSQCCSDFLRRAVQNPEPEGIETHTLLDILCALCDKRVVGFDVLEVAPNYDQGVSAIQETKVAFEVLCALEKSGKGKRHGRNRLQALMCSAKL